MTNFKMILKLVAPKKNMPQKCCILLLWGFKGGLTDLHAPEALGFHLFHHGQVVQGVLWCLLHQVSQGDLSHTAASKTQTNHASCHSLHVKTCSNKNILCLAVQVLTCWTRFSCYTRYVSSEAWGTRVTLIPLYTVSTHDTFPARCSWRTWKTMSKRNDWKTVLSFIDPFTKQTSKIKITAFWWVIVECAIFPLRLHISLSNSVPQLHSSLGWHHFSLPTSTNQLALANV